MSIKLPDKLRMGNLSRDYKQYDGPIPGSGQVCDTFEYCSRPYDLRY